MLNIRRPTMRGFKEIRIANFPETQAEKASPNAAAEIKPPETMARRYAGVPSSSRKSAMIGPKVRSAMFTKNRIRSDVKYSGCLQNPESEGDASTISFAG